MCCQRILALIVCLLVVMPQQTFAWNSHGHRVIASLTFLRMDPVVRLEFAQRLRKHPRFEEDFLAKMPENVKAGDEQVQAEWLFQQASVWPDTVQNLAEVEKEKYHHPRWHYVNWPEYLNPNDELVLTDIKPIKFKVPTEASEEMNVVQAIQFAEQRIKGEVKVSEEEQALMICWFLHCYSDMHQPWHTHSFYSQHLFPTGCRGGNFIPTQQSRNMHALWDGLLGSDDKFLACHNQAVRMLEDKSTQENLNSVGKDHAKAFDVAAIDMGALFAFCTATDIKPHLVRLEKEKAEQIPPMNLNQAYLRQIGNDARNAAQTCSWRMSEILSGKATSVGSDY